MCLLETVVLVAGLGTAIVSTYFAQVNHMNSWIPSGWQGFRHLVTLPRIQQINCCKSKELRAHECSICSQLVFFKLSFSISIISRSSHSPFHPVLTGCWGICTLVKKPRREHFVNVATYYSEAVSQEGETALKCRSLFIDNCFWLLQWRL